jgi:2-polyprenyl-3-methyl-5-hydroxy-6-metoxy-1,4-benzoquinol methylase
METGPKTQGIDQAMNFAFKVVADLAAAMAGPLIYIGDRLGLFKTLAEQGPMTVQQLAKKTGLQECYLREWTSAMATSQYLDYDPAAKTFGLNESQAMVLAQEGGPLFVQGFAQMIPDHYARIPGILRAMKEGGGVPYSEYGEDTFEGTERFFAGGYKNFLVQEWIPATGFEERLKKGARVADVGCGRGVAVITMAKAFPKSQFVGFDNYAPSVEAANEKAKAAGVAANARFEVCASTALPQNKEFDLICNFDSLHDMVDPEGCARSVLGALRPDGAWMVVEPNVSDRLEENIHPLGKAFYSVSMLQCMTASLAQGGKGYGACMGPGKLREIALQAGFRSHERLPVNNPFNAITIFRP